jgi:hypothetical protein
MKLELIQSVNPVTPKTGSNAGKLLFVINAKHWSKIEPKAEDTHVCLEDALVDGKTYTNVVGFSKDSRMCIADKIALVTSNDPGFSMAIASLLR